MLEALDYIGDNDLQSCGRIIGDFWSYKMSLAVVIFVERLMWRLGKFGQYPPAGLTIQFQ